MKDEKNETIDGLIARLVASRQLCEAVYRERNRLVALLATMYPSGIRPTQIEGWDLAWNNCVYIDTPAGQMSWHYHDKDAAMFDHLPPYHKPWDGHSSEEKHHRLDELIKMIASKQ